MDDDDDTVASALADDWSAENNATIVDSTTVDWKNEPAWCNPSRSQIFLLRNFVRLSAFDFEKCRSQKQ